MSHKVYRICLLSVVLLAIVGGIFYYLNYVQKKSDITEGTLVRHELWTQEQPAVQEWTADGSFGEMDLREESVYE